MRIVKLLVVLVVLCFGMTMNAIAQESPAAPASPAAEVSPAAPASPAAAPEVKKEFVCEKCSVTKDAAGKCEKCGADLVEKAPAAPATPATPAAPAPEATPAAK